jgi:hypothetical protein
VRGQLAQPGAKYPTQDSEQDAVRAGEDSLARSHLRPGKPLLFGASRRQVSAIADPLYFALLNFLDAKDAVQDEARARLVGTYKLWRYALEHEDEVVLGKMTVSEDPRTHALMTDVIVARKSAHGLRGSCNRFVGYLFSVSRMYFMITRNRRTDDLRMTLFSRFRMDEVGMEINPRSIFAGRRNHIVHMDHARDGRQQGVCLADAYLAGR